MKLLIAITLAALAAASFFYYENKKDLESQNVVDVDLSRYVGLWYEIYRLPFFFERNCYCTNANYTLNPDVTVGVRNACNLKSSTGELHVSNGVATPVDPVNGTVTEGDFDVKFNIIGGGSYLILALDENYQYALVGTALKRELWILSRTPTLSQDIVSQLLSVATQNGYDVSKLIQTYQGSDCAYGDDFEPFE